MENSSIYNQFQTQMLLPKFGIEAQLKLQNAKVLVIGAGGLGCPCIQYLIGAGIGTVGICDGDWVELSNLHRQILFTSNDIGKKKASVIFDKLQHVFSSIKIIVYDYFLEQKTAIELFPEYDIVIDCTDDIQTRYLINDACVLLKKPLVYGAVFQYEGQVSILNCDNKKINLRDVFAEEKHKNIFTCNNSGALGAITGMIGTMQSLEAIKYITGIEGGLKNELLICNFIEYSFYKIEISKRKNNVDLPHSISEFLNKKYTQICFEKNTNSYELTQKEFLDFIQNKNIELIDVRNENELPKMNFANEKNIPLQTLLKNTNILNKEKTILLYCHAGIRSLEALEFLKEECGFEKVFHLKGGLLKWKYDER